MTLTKTLYYTGIGEDYIPTDPFIVTFSGGTNSSAMECVSVMTVDDEALESNNTFTVGLESATPSPNVDLGSPSSVTITIIDDEGTYFIVLSVIFDIFAAS